MVVSFQISGYRTFKHVYLRLVLVHWKPSFPRLPSYNRFVELMAEVLTPLTAFMHSRCGKSNGIAFVDSTPLNVDDRTPVPYLANDWVGKLFGDRGTISKKLTELLATQDVALITTLKKNRKPRVLAAFDKLILRKRSSIETLNDL